jgi:hypothetical protein
MFLVITDLLDKYGFISFSASVTPNTMGHSTAETPSTAVPALDSFSASEIRRIPNNPVPPPLRHHQPKRLDIHYERDTFSVIRPTHPLATHAKTQKHSHSKSVHKTCFQHASNHAINIPNYATPEY